MTQHPCVGHQKKRDLHYVTSSHNISPKEDNQLEKRLYADFNDTV